MTQPITDLNEIRKIVADSVRDLSDELRGGMSAEEVGQMAADVKAIKAAQERFAEERASDQLSDNRKTQASVREYEKVTGFSMDHDPKKGKGLRAGAYLRALANGHRTGRPVQAVLSDWGFKALADEAAQVRALQSGAAGAGGELFPGGFLNELIELQRNMSAVRQIPGIRTLQMPNGTLTIKKQTGAGTASWVGEGAVIGSSQQATGSITLTGKKLAALTAVSNDLLRIADANADGFVRDDLAAEMALAEDLAFLRGTGVGGQPRGIRNSVAAAMVVATGGDTAAAKRNDLVNAVARLAARNVRFNSANAAWLMSERTKYRLMATVDGNSTPSFPGLETAGTLLGYQVLATNQILNTTGDGDESEIYFVCGPECIIGEVRGLELAAMDGAAYYNSTASAVQSGFSQDETAIRAILVEDFGLRHDNGAAIISEVDYTVS
jgi:HK97 family phage major capsid protein